MQIIFLLSACTSILAVFLICYFLFANGVPAIGKIGIGNFLLGKVWKPTNNLFGIFPMILGSIYVTAGAIVIGVPIGIMTAMYLALFCERNLQNHKTGHRITGGDSVGCLRLLRDGCDRPVCSGEFGWERKQHAFRLLIMWVS